MRSHCKYLVASVLAGLVAGLAVNANAAEVFRPEEQVLRILTPKDGEKLGVLARANLDKPRPKAPFDLTGTWRFQREVATGGWEFHPVPKLTPAAETEHNAYLKAKAEGKNYKDDAGACYPPGMPRIMTRVWSMQVIQLPTMVLMIHGFENSVRWIYTDGRKHTSLDELVPSYNGESIGHWEGDTLVIDTIGIEPAHHWMQLGIPTSDKLHIVERITLSADGNTFEDKLIMTDPENWEGEWINTKKFNLRDDEDIFEVHCIAADQAKLPSAGSAFNVR